MQNAQRFQYTSCMYAARLKEHNACIYDHAYVHVRTFTSLCHVYPTCRNNSACTEMLDMHICRVYACDVRSLASTFAMHKKRCKHIIISAAMCVFTHGSRIHICMHAYTHVRMSMHMAQKTMQTHNHFQSWCDVRRMYTCTLFCIENCMYTFKQPFHETQTHATKNKHRKKIENKLHIKKQ